MSDKEEATVDFGRALPPEGNQSVAARLLGGELLAMLRELEWMGTVPYDQGRCCPECENTKREGVHLADCRLDALLRRYRR